MTHTAISTPAHCKRDNTVGDFAIGLCFALRFAGHRFLSWLRDQIKQDIAAGTGSISPHPSVLCKIINIEKYATNFRVCIRIFQPLFVLYFVEETMRLRERAKNLLLCVGGVEYSRPARTRAIDRVGRHFGVL